MTLAVAFRRSTSAIERERQLRRLPTSPSRPFAVAHGRQLPGNLKIIAAILERPVIEEIFPNLELPAHGQALQAP